MAAMNAPSDRAACAPVILITGAAKRVGAAIARRLHADGCSLVLHYRQSADAMQALVAELEQSRAGSVISVHAELTDMAAMPALVDAAISRFGKLDGLVNNASAFFATPLDEASEAQWDALMNANAKAPFFLAQAAAPHLRAQRGAIVNIIDIYGERPLPRHPIYSISKAALRMATLALAEALGPDVRVNAIAPGTVLWSDNPLKAETAEQVEKGTTLKRVGQPEEVAVAVRFLLLDASYTTGMVLPVEGGRLLSV